MKVITHPKRYYSGMTQQQVADQMGVSERRIQQIEKRALLKLLKAIQQRAQWEGVSVKEWLFGEPGKC